MPQSPQEREWLALARSESTSPEILREIAAAIRHHPGPSTRGTGTALARNPNTPLETLLRLAEDYPATLCRNPVAPLLLLECPDWITRLSHRARRRLLCLPNLPPSWERFLAPDDDAEARDAAAQHVATAGEIAAAEWEGEVRDYLRRLAQVPPGAGRAAQRELVTFGLAPAWSADFPREDQEADDLIPSGIPVERHADIRALLGLDGKPRLPLRASRELQQAFHPRTCRSFLSRLAESTDWLVCLAVASHPAVGTRTLTELLQHFAPTDMTPERKPVFELLRAAVLLNPSTPMYILDKFAWDNNPALRRALRRLPNAPRCWTDASRERTQREVKLWSLPEGRRLFRHHYNIPYLYQDNLYLCMSCPIPFSITEAPPTPFCAINAIANSPLPHKEQQWRIRAAARSESHYIRLGAALSSALTEEPKTLELLCGDACRLVRAVARARRNLVDWKFVL